ncbi:MAG TPA: transcriptional repressor [Planctomycetes bacterium]|nr:transcriptional repressor [Planctomycetota bacterium]
MSDSNGRESRGKLTERMDAFRAMCRREGLKVTPQRLAVYKALVESTEHPSAEAVFRQVRKNIPDISFDTVNRTLLMLSNIDAAFVIEGTGSPKRFDANLKTHHHFKCIKCKRIIDVWHEPFDKIQVPRSIEEKFTVSRKTVYLEGICDKCRGK